MKELVEHIRTVHFTILVVVLALTAALQIENRRPLERAAEDAETILLLSQRWYDLDAAIDKTLNQSVEGLATRNTTLGFSESTYVNPDSDYHAEFTKGDGDTAVVLFKMPYRWLELEKINGHYVLVQPPSHASANPSERYWSSHVARWTTLNGFLDTWNKLRDGERVFVPTVLRESIDSGSCRSLGGGEGTPKGRRSYENDGIRYYVTPSGSQSFKLQITPVIDDPDDPRGESCTFVADVREIELDFGGVIKSVSPNAARWGTGSSESEFPELIAASKYLGDTPIENLAAALRDRANADTERIEIFQAKLSASSIPTFGSIVLVLCELYLMAHLFELRKLLGRDVSVEWPTGYIGLYSNILVFAFTVATLVIFPLVPLVWSAIRNTGSMRVLSVVAFGISLLLGLGSSLILFLIRKRHLVLSPKANAL